MTQLFLIARIAGRDVAIEASEVESVVNLGDVVATPRVSPSVRGLAALRSRVVTVIDPTIVLESAPATDGSRAIVTTVDGHSYAVLVDEVRDVVPCAPQPLTPGLSLDRSWSYCATGMIDSDQGLMLVVRLASLLPRAALAA